MKTASGRLDRFLFAFAAGISLLICLATAALWDRSYSTADVLTSTHRYPDWQIDTMFGDANGKILLRYDVRTANYRLDPPPFGLYPGFASSSQWFKSDMPPKIMLFYCHLAINPEDDRTAQFAGIRLGWHDDPHISPRRHYVAILPMWAICVISAILPAFRLRRIIARRTNRSKPS
ncbi:MAG TPA: hypothetical protein VFE47_26595 [Tepidisphaeraceae bacterium]|jgi:hypothetical protein|nr:hypothetical protein [Tepidisphaeraceae bacterium]